MNEMSCLLLLCSDSHQAQCGTYIPFFKNIANTTIIWVVGIFCICF